MSNFPARTGEIRRLITDSTQRNNYPDHDRVWPVMAGLTILIIVGSNTLPLYIITLGCIGYTIVLCNATLKAPQDIRLISTQRWMSGAGAMTHDVMCSGGGGGLDTGHWLETGDSDSDDAGARAGAGSILLHNSGLIWTRAINNLNFCIVGLAMNPGDYFGLALCSQS